MPGKIRYELTLRETPATNGEISLTAGRERELGLLNRITAVRIVHKVRVTSETEVRSFRPDIVYVMDYRLPDDIFSASTGTGLQTLQLAVGTEVSDRCLHLIIHLNNSTFMYPASTLVSWFKEKVGF